MKILIGETINYNSKTMTVSHRNKYLAPKTLKYIKGDNYTCVYFDNNDEEFHGITLTSSEIEPQIISQNYHMQILHFVIGDYVQLKSGSPQLLVENINDEEEIFMTVSYHKSTSELVHYTLSRDSLMAVSSSNNN